MSDVALTEQHQPARRPRATQIRGKLRSAIKAMVWQGLPRGEAAQAAGMTEHGLYKALRKPPVKAHYLAELEILRTSERARNIHALTEVREQRDNAMARVNAVKALEQLGEQEAHRSSGSVRSPGMSIVVIQQVASQTPHLPLEQAKALILQHHDGVSRETDRE
jgi:hypothetical protein